MYVTPELARLREIELCVQVDICIVKIDSVNFDWATLHALPPQVLRPGPGRLVDEFHPPVRGELTDRCHALRPENTQPTFAQVVFRTTRTEIWSTYFEALWFFCDLSAALKAKPDDSATRERDQKSGILMCLPY